MFRQTSTCVLMLVTGFSCFGGSVHAQKSSSSSLQDIYYDYELYYGVPETVYDLIVVYEGGREELDQTFLDPSALSNQLRDYERGFGSSSFVDWYWVKDTRIERWYKYSYYRDLASAESNAAWLQDMGYGTDIRYIYNPTFRRR